MPERKSGGTGLVTEAEVDKAPDAFRTISEVAEELELPQHVLRFWESRFAQIKPMKRGGGRRYYRPDDVDLLRGIRHLLYGEGYTIRGVQRILREQGGRFVQSVWRDGAPQPAPPASVADDDEDIASEADGLESTEDVRQSARGEPAFEGAGALSGRVEPTLAPLPSLEPVPSAQPAQAVQPMHLPSPAQLERPALSREDLERLKQVLDELIKARRLLDNACSGSAEG